MQPVGLGAARIEVNGDVINVLLELPVQRSTEPAAPCLSLLRVPHHTFGMRACLAPVGALVVLIKRVGSPEALVAVGTRVFSPSLVKLLQVPLPVELSLECLIARGAPEFAIGRLSRCGRGICPG